MKKKILFINPFLIQGGVEHSLITALRNLDPEKYEITLFLYIEKLDLLPEVPDYVETVVAEDHRKYFRYPKSLLLLARSRFARARGKISKADALERELNEYIHAQKVNFAVEGPLSGRQFDTVVSYSLHIGSEMALTVPAGRHIVFMHSSKPEYHREIAEHTFDRFDRIVTVGAGVDEVFHEAYPQFGEKFYRLDNYVPAGEIREKAAAERIPFPEGKAILCSCGRLSREKGHDLAVKAAALLKEKGISFVWYFVGDGAEREKLEAQIAGLGLGNEIVITGLQSNPYPYMGGCDIYVQPSYEEAQPLTVIEALKLNRAVVSTKTVGGVTLLRNGEWGVLTDFTPEAIAAGIEKLLCAPALRERFAASYSPAEDAAEQTEYRRKWSELLE